MPPKKSTESESEKIPRQSLHTPAQFNLKPVTHAELLNGVYSAFSYDKIPQTFYNRMRLNTQRDKPEHVQFILRVHLDDNSSFKYSTFCNNRFCDLSKMQSSLKSEKELFEDPLYAWYELNSQNTKSDHTNIIKKSKYKYKSK